MKRIAIVVLSAVCFAGSAFAADPAASSGAPAAASTPTEQKRLINVEFNETPLGTVLSVLSAKTGYKFVTDTELAHKKIVLNLKEVKPEEALSALLDTYNLYYVRQGDTNIYSIKIKPEATVTTVTKVIFLNYAAAKGLDTVFKSNLSKHGNIAADEQTNSLIITDLADNIDRVESLIRTIDLPPMQVQLEAKIVDVKLDSTLNLGVDINNLYRTNYFRSPLAIEQGLTPFAQPQVSYSGLMGPALVNQGGQVNVSVISGDYALQATLQALKKDQNAKLLSNPRLLVMNNQSASIDIIEQVPYEERTISGNTTTITTMFKDVGIRLKVKPQVNRDGSIVLNVNPEQSFRTGEAFNNAPVVNTSKTQTVFMLKDGETAVIGGLVRENDSETEYKVPLLGDIPILGYLFKRTNKQKVRSELTIFITARIVQR